MFPVAGKIGSKRYFGDNPMSIINKQSGLTLVEVLIVLSIVSFGMLAIAKFQADLLHEGGTNKARIQALSHGLDKVEDLRINHATAAAGSEDITGINAEYELIWTVGSFSGVTNAQRYATTIDWTDTVNRNQSMELGTVVYPDSLYTSPAGAARCISGESCVPPPPPPPPDVDIELGDREDLIVDEDWPGIENPTEETTGSDGTSGDDKIYNSGHVSSDLDLGSGDDKLYVTGQIKDNLDAGSGDDQIQVEGHIKGDVDLGAGNDILKTDGHVQDDIDAGDGNDVIIIEQQLQGTVDLGDGNDRLFIDGHLKGDVSAGDGDDLLSVGGKVQDDIEMDGGDDFVVVSGQIQDDIDGGSGNDSICLESYSSANWSSISSQLSSFENIKTSDGVVVQGSSTFFGVGCNYSSNWGGSGGDYLYLYPITLTITPQSGFDQVSSITLINEILGTEISGVMDNGDGTFTVPVDVNNEASFDLLTNELFTAEDLTTEETNEWVDNEQSVTVTLKEQP